MENFMKNDILEKANELIDYISKSDNYVRYKELVEKIKKNDEIMNLIKDIKSLQKQAIKLNHSNKDVSRTDQEIAIKIKKLEEYPVYVEMNYLQDDLNSSLYIIKETLDNYIDKQIN